MWEEAERRNGALTEEDRAKNLRWAVVGGKGEKRLIKTTARPQQQTERGGFHPRRGGNQVPRGGQQGPRGGQQAPRGGQVIRGVYRLPVNSSRTVNREDDIQTQSSRSLGEQQQRGSNKRRERSPEGEEMEEDGQPPEKRQDVSSQSYT